MRILKCLALLIGFGLFFNSCSDDEAEPTIDTEKPSIDLSVAGTFPTSCDTMYFDEEFNIKVLLKDNAELGSYNIDIHHNFDQHTHSTEFEKCTLDAIKTAVNPFVFIQDYTIPASSSEYTIEMPMTVPGSDGTNKYDDGDYHFQVRVTDKEGWSSFIGLNVKILHR